MKTSLLILVVYNNTCNGAISVFHVYLKTLNRNKPSSPEIKLFHLPLASFFFVHALWWRCCNLLCSRKFKRHCDFLSFILFINPRHLWLSIGNKHIFFLLGSILSCYCHIVLLLKSPTPLLLCFPHPTASFLFLFHPNCTTKWVYTHKINHSL